MCPSASEGSLMQTAEFTKSSYIVHQPPLVKRHSTATTSVLIQFAFCRRILTLYIQRPVLTFLCLLEGSFASLWCVCCLVLCYYNFYHVAAKLLQVLSKERDVFCTVRSELEEKFNMFSILAVIGIPLVMGPILCPVFHILLRCHTTNRKRVFVHLIAFLIGGWRYFLDEL